MYEDLEYKGARIMLCKHGLQGKPKDIRYFLSHINEKDRQSIPSQSGWVARGLNYRSNHVVYD